MPYIVSVCGEEGFGKVGVGYSFALISIVLIDYGSYINGTKEISIHSNDNKILCEKFATIYFAKFILILSVLLLSSILILSIPFFQKDYLQLLLSLLIVVGQFINPTWFFQGIQNFKWISAINILSKCIYLACVFLFIKTPADYIYANAFFGIGLITASFSGFIWIYSKYDFSFQHTSLEKALNLLKEEFNLTASQLFFSLYQYAPVMIISYVGGDLLAGQFRIIDQIIMIFRTYFQMFFNFIYAEVCLKIFQDSEQGLKVWFKFNFLNYCLVGAMLIFSFFMANDILSFFNVDLVAHHYLLSIFKLGLLIPLLMGITFALKQLMFAYNKNTHYIQITIISSILYLIIVYFLVKAIGLAGSFITTLVMEFLIIFLYIVVLRRNFLKTSKHL